MSNTATSTDQIQKQVTFDAPRSRVWRALTDVHQFNTWFGVNLESPFTPGAEVAGNVRFKGMEHMRMSIWIDRMEPEHFFSFRWHPYAVEEGVDYSSEPKTLVSFTLEDEGEKTRLSIVESGFDAIPEERRAKAFAMNTGGWNAQAENLRKFVEGSGVTS